MIIIRYQDIPEDGGESNQPPGKVVPRLLGNERVVSVETIKDGFGYAVARVWIIGDN